MYCKNCGQYIDDNSKFCKYCGTSQAIMASVGVINRTSGRSGVLEIASNINVENFVSMLFAKGWIPNSASAISSLRITATKDGYIIYSSKGPSSDNKETLLDTLAEHDSDDVFIDYKETSIHLDDDFYPRRKSPYRGDMVCLYGCPNAEEVTAETEDNMEFSKKMYQLYYDL